MVGVAELRRMPNQVTVIDRTGARDDFDHVVIAAHADQAHAMLGDADTLETACLGGWRYTTNQAVLHRDRRLMPRRQRVWSSWNFIEGGAATDDQALCVTYWMNRLQSLAGPDLFVTLNPAIAPRDDLVIDSYNSHPYFDQQAWPVSAGFGTSRASCTWYCGSYFGAGFHEDALQAGLAVAEAWVAVGGPGRWPTKAAASMSAPLCPRWPNHALGHLSRRGRAHPSEPSAPSPTLQRFLHAVRPRRVGRSGSPLHPVRL